jgi:GNAT superfamily N-acetyltransferase
MAAENQMEFVEFETLSLADWVALIRPERTPFGAATAGVEVRGMDRYVGVRDEGGHLRCVIGATIARVTVEGHGPLEVVGVGGLLVHRDFRALGLGRELMDRMREMTAEWGPDRAMLFCEPHLRPLYSRRGYNPLSDEVWVDQPTGAIIMPAHAMWRPIRQSEWPPGVIHVHGLPF